MCKKITAGAIWSGLLSVNQVHIFRPLVLVGIPIASYRVHRGVGSRSCHVCVRRQVAFDPKSNTVTTDSGDQISYEYLVVAMGLQTNWDGVSGDLLICIWSQWWAPYNYFVAAPLNTNHHHMKPVTNDVKLSSSSGIVYRNESTTALFSISASQF